MTGGKCRWGGCKEVTPATHCEAHAVLYAERAKRKLEPPEPPKCCKCFLPGHDESACRWVPSIRASYKTPAQAAGEID